MADTVIVKKKPVCPLCGSTEIVSWYGEDVTFEHAIDCPDHPVPDDLDNDKTPTLTAPPVADRFAVAGSLPNGWTGGWKIEDGMPVFSATKVWAQPAVQEGSVMWTKELP